MNETRDNLELEELRAELAMWRARQQRLEATGKGVDLGVGGSVGEGVSMRG